MKVKKVVNEDEPGEHHGGEREIPVEEVYWYNELTLEEAKECLNYVSETYRHYECEKLYSYPSYAYTAMEVPDRSLTNIEVVVNFIYVVYLNLSHNKFKDEGMLPLRCMQQLLVLIADHNILETASIPSLLKLQILDLGDNRITTTEVNDQPELTCLNLNYNNIQSVQENLWGPSKLPHLKELSLRGNGLKSLSGINFPNLVSLFLGENDIASLEGLAVLSNLKFLHLRENPIKNLDGLLYGGNQRLFYINLRNCKLGSNDELSKLTTLPRLERLVLKGNPLEKKLGRNYRTCVLHVLPKLGRIDKRKVTDRERKKAEDMGGGMEEQEVVGDED